MSSVTASRWEMELKIHFTMRPNVMENNNNEKAITESEKTSPDNLSFLLFKTLSKHPHLRITISHSACSLKGAAEVFLSMFRKNTTH